MIKLVIPKIAFLIPSKAFPINSVKLKLSKNSAAEVKPILSSMKANAPLIASNKPPTTVPKNPLANPIIPAIILENIPPS